MEKSQQNEINSNESVARKEEELNDLKMKLENMGNNLKNLEEMKRSSETQLDEIRSRSESFEKMYVNNLKCLLILSIYLIKRKLHFKAY